MQVEASTRSHAGNNFDFLRFAMATIVIFFHSYIISSVVTREPIARLTHGQVSIGVLSVGGFFAISGYLITASWLRSKAVLGYFIKRVLRIYPAFLVVSMLCVFVVGPLGAYHSSIYLHHLHKANLIFHMFLLDKPVNTPATFDALRNASVLNGSMWTIRPEFECYIMTALLGIAGLLGKRRIILVLFAAITALNAFINLHLGPARLQTDQIIDHASWFTYYITGIVFLLYSDKIKFKLPYFGAALALLVVLSLTHIFKSFASIPVTYCLMFLAFYPFALLNRFARFFDVSYGMYLFAWPVQMLCVYYLGAKLTPLELFGIAAPTTFLFALASWFLIEKPFLKMKPKSAKPVSLNGDDVVALSP